MFKWWGFGGVDFKQHILLDPFALQDAGRLNARFLKEDLDVMVDVKYLSLEGLCMAWVAHGN